MSKKKLIVLIGCIVSVVGIGSVIGVKVWQDKNSLSAISDSFDKFNAEQERSEEATKLFEKALTATNSYEAEALLQKAAKLKFGDGYKLKRVSDKKMDDLMREKAELELETGSVDSSKLSVKERDKLIKKLDRIIEIGYIEAYNEIE